MKAMRGVVHIERENSDGDRGIVRTIDLEGLPAAIDRMEFVRQATRDALEAPNACVVRAMHDQGWALEIIAVERLKP